MGKASFILVFLCAITGVTQDLGHTNHNRVACGKAMMTTWDVDYKNGTLKFLGRSRIPDQTHCLFKPSRDVSNATIKIYSEDNTVIREFGFFVADVAYWDEVAQKGTPPKGGFVNLDQQVLFIKLVDDKTMMKAKKMSLHLDNGKVLGPSLLHRVGG